jgi:Transglutaminase-like superfamily
MKAILFILLFFCLCVKAQTAENIDFTAVDSIARTHKYKGDLKLLVSELTNGYDTPLQKARAIFVWVTDNIADDVKAYNKKRKPFKCRNKKNCDAERQAYEDEYIDDVLSSGKGVCQGYANLFKRMCDYAGLQTDVIGGYVKNNSRMVGKMGVLDHAWNGIILDGKYYYIDATWGAGYSTKNKKGKLEKFNKEFNEYYWLTPVDKFYRNHYPAQETPYTSAYYQEKYKNGAYVANWALACSEVTEPQSGIISTFRGDTLHFEMAYECDYPIEKLQVNTNRKHNPNIWKDNEKTEINQNALKKQQYTNFRLENGVLNFDFVVKDKSLKYLEVLVNHKYTLYKFNVSVIEYLPIFGKKVYLKKHLKP